MKTDLITSQVGAAQHKLLQQNTELTEVTRQLSQRIEELTKEMHDKIVEKKAKPQMQTSV
jgi:hypothetical protein